MSLKLEERDEEFPDSWQQKSIAEICELGGGSTPRKSKDEYWGGNVPWVSPKDFYGVEISDTEDKLTEKALEESSITVYEPGAIAIVVRSGVLKHSLPIARLERPATVNQDVKVLKPDTSVVLEGFLLNLLRYEADRIRTSCSKTGTTVESIEMSFLKGYKLPLPPRPEQRRIAAVLSTVDEEIQQTDEIIESVKELREGLIQDLVFYGIDNDDTQEVQLGPLTTEVAALWDIATVGDVTTTVQYGCSESLSQEGEYPMFRMNNIVEGEMVDSPMKYVDLNPEQAEKYEVEKGDILFNRTNSIDLVGKTGIFDLEDQYVFASYLIRLQTTDEMNPCFLNYYLNSKTGQDILFSYATRGASQANINAASLKSVKVPRPPRSEQDRIVERLQTVEEKLEREREKKEAHEDLKRGLMQDLLTGEVRVGVFGN